MRPRLGVCARLGRAWVVEKPLASFLGWSGVTVFMERAPGARHGLGNGGSGGLYGMGLVCWGVVRCEVLGQRRLLETSVAEFCGGVGRDRSRRGRFIDYCFLRMVSG